jgi:hypothetical protein
MDQSQSYFFVYYSIWCIIANAPQNPVNSPYSSLSQTYMRGACDYITENRYNAVQRTKTQNRKEYITKTLQSLLILNIECRRIF